MSFSMTVDAFKDGSKTVTRRHPGTWKGLVPGMRLMGVEKGMGLRKGQHQVLLGVIEIVDVRVEPIELIDQDDCAREGCPTYSPAGFVSWWMDSHGYRNRAPGPDILCRRIEFRHVRPAYITTGSPHVSFVAPQPVDRLLGKVIDTGRNGPFFPAGTVFGVAVSAYVFTADSPAHASGAVDIVLA